MIGGRRKDFFYKLAAVCYILAPLISDSLQTLDLPMITPPPLFVLPIYHNSPGDTCSYEPESRMEEGCTLKSLWYRRCKTSVCNDVRRATGRELATTLSAAEQYDRTW